MEVRRAVMEDFDTLMDIYADARLLMRDSGNGNQWIEGYPSDKLIMNDIANGNSYVCVDSHNSVVGVFCFVRGNDATYDRIYGGQWLNDEPYGVIHRLAGKKGSNGIAASCLRWCFEQCNNIRIDTHRDNIIMQNILRKNGFTQCGIIYIANGTARIAFQKVVEHVS
jgi:RimJ/RimL family protein N-acetyltransferase